MDAGMAELRRAWASAEDPEAAYKMLPAAAPVPIWVGGSSPAARRRAATLGDGWIPLFLKPTELVTQYELLGNEAVAAGRDPADVAHSVVVPVAVGDGPDVSDVGCAWLSDLYGIPAKAFARHLVSGPPERCAERITAYFEAGARHVALFVASARPLDQFAPLAAALGGTICGGTNPDSPERAQLAGVGA
jgi:alkanesulfonate monooxygenase SsuD/methylene tetrahydromethanopterin reductase-like flavin-dependent oxidoreductase (luciferase family)